MMTVRFNTVDCSAPIGFRLAVKHPERITAIVSQNGNTYLEGVSEAFAPIQAYWNDPSDANRDALRGFAPAGAEAFKRDVPEADIRFVDSGHFALETHAREIAAAMREFLAKHVG
jgi:pimeloyl-ACP methyl ester carboxylesterase